jgi:excisionase family DNA binding protein
MQRPSMSADIFTLREVADYLKVTERTLYRLVAERQIPAFKVGGGWRFRRTDLDAWIGRNIVAEEPAAVAARRDVAPARAAKARR